MSKNDFDDGSVKFAKDPELKIDKKLAKPRLYKVIILNDDYTTMEFVIEILQKYFHHSLEAAVNIMKKVHQTGKGIAGLYTFDVAQTKAQEVLEEAKAREFPLSIKLEPEENT